MSAPCIVDTMQNLDGERFARTREHLATVRRIAAARFDATGIQSAELAIEWAISSHIEQRDRPDGAPYVEHVTSVAARVLGWAARPSPELCAAALLHDALEDQEERLAARAPAGGNIPDRARAAVVGAFGPRVLAMMNALTNPDFDAMARAEHGCAGKSPALAAVKLALYQLHFVEIFNTHREAALIKLADFTDNALSLGGLRAAHPAQFTKLTRKYGPCVAFAIDELEAVSNPEDPLYGVRDAMLPVLREAWSRFYAPGGPAPTA